MPNVKIHLESKNDTRFTISLARIEREHFSGATGFRFYVGIGHPSTNRLQMIYHTVFGYLGCGYRSSVYQESGDLGLPSPIERRSSCEFGYCPPHRPSTGARIGHLSIEYTAITGLYCTSYACENTLQAHIICHPRRQYSYLIERNF